jgi:purine-binding chemotaxis protein CheW
MAGPTTLVLVQIGPQQFALDVMSVREFRGWAAPTPLPGAPDHVLGMGDLRGAVVPIVDLGRSLGLGPTQATAASVVVVVQAPSGMVGLLVDAVCELITVQDDALQATPDTGREGLNAVVRGAFNIDGRILGMIAIDGLIASQLAAAA